MSHADTEEELWEQVHELTAQAEKAMVPDASNAEMQQIATYFKATRERARTILETAKILETQLKPALKSKPAELPNEIRTSFLNLTELVRQMGYGTRDDESIAADQHRSQDIWAYSHGIKLPLQNMSLRFGDLITKITWRQIPETGQSR